MNLELREITFEFMRRTFQIYVIIKKIQKYAKKTSVIDNISIFIARVPKISQIICPSTSFSGITSR